MNLFKVILLLTTFAISTVHALEEDLSPKDELSDEKHDLEASDSSTNVKRYIANNYIQKGNKSGSHNKYNRSESKSRKFRSKNRKSRQKKGRSMKKINAENRDPSQNVTEIDVTPIAPKIKNPKLSNTQSDPQNVKNETYNEIDAKNQVFLQNNKTEETNNKSTPSSIDSISNNLSDIIPNQNILLTQSNPETSIKDTNVTEPNNNKKLETEQKEIQLDHPKTISTTPKVEDNSSKRINELSEVNNEFGQTKTKYDLHINQVKPNYSSSTNSYEPKQIIEDLERTTQNKLESSGSDEKKYHEGESNSSQTRLLDSKLTSQKNNSKEHITRENRKIEQEEFQSNNPGYSLTTSKPKEEEEEKEEENIKSLFRNSKPSDDNVKELQSNTDKVQTSQTKAESKAASEPEQTKDDIAKEITRIKFKSSGSDKSTDHENESNNSPSRSITSRSPKQNYNTEKKHMRSKAEDEKVRTHVGAKNDEPIRNKIKPEHAGTVSEPDKFETHLSESDLEFIISELINTDTNHQNEEHLPESKSEPDIERHTPDNNIFKTLENNAHDLKQTQHEVSVPKLKKRVSISKSGRNIPKQASENESEKSNSGAEPENPIFHSLKPVNVEIQYEIPLPNYSKIEPKSSEPNNVNREELNREKLDSVSNVRHRKNYGPKPKIPTVSPVPKFIQTEPVSINRGHNYNEHKFGVNRKNIGTEENHRNIKFAHGNDEEKASPSKTSFLPKHEISVPIYHEVVLELESPTSGSREKTTELKDTHVKDTDIKPLNGDKEIGEEPKHKLIRYGPHHITTNDKNKIKEYEYRSNQPKHEEREPKHQVRELKPPQVVLEYDKPDQGKKYFVSTFSPVYRPISSTETSYNKNIQTYIKPISQRPDINYHIRTEHIRSIPKPKVTKPVYPQANSEHIQSILKPKVTKPVYPQANSEHIQSILKPKVPKPVYPQANSETKNLKPYQREYQIKYKNTDAIYRTSTLNPNGYESRFRRLEPKKSDEIPNYSTKSDSTQRRYIRPTPESKKDLVQNVEERYIRDKPRNTNILAPDNSKRIPEPTREKFVPKYDDSKSAPREVSTDVSLSPETTTSGRNFLLKALKDWW